MADYGIFFNFEGETIRMPVNPEEIGYKQSRDSKRYTVLKLGEINVLGDTKLREIKLELPLPDSWYHFCAVAESALKPPSFYIERFEQYISSKKPVRLVITGTPIPMNMLVSIEDMELIEKAGEDGFIYASLDLREYREYKAVVYNMNAATNELYQGMVLTQNTPPPSLPTEVKAREGDTLYMLAARTTGKGENCYYIAEYNGLITSEPLSEGQIIYIPEGLI